MSSLVSAGDTITPADIFPVFLNKHAGAGYAFRYAIQVRDGEYMMIFEKVVM